MLPHESTVYVIAAWGGWRRVRDALYDADHAHYLRFHLHTLAKLKHRLDQVLIVVAREEPADEGFREYLESIPRFMGNTRVSIMHRENCGGSYGSFSDAYAMLRENKRFAWYFFAEDDFVWAKDNFDQEMKEDFLAFGDCCYYGTCLHTARKRLHIGVPNGLTRAEFLEETWKKRGCLPHAGTLLPDVSANYKLVEWEGNVQMTHAIWQDNPGTKLYDLSHRYRFCWLSPPGRERWYWTEANQDELILPTQIALKRPIFAGYNPPRIEAAQEKSSKELNKLYLEFCLDPTDINQHLPKLKELAGEHHRVTEFGVRFGRSTAAFLAAQPRRLACYDLVRWPIVDQMARLAGRTEFSFTQGDSRTVEIDETDLLFIDTTHTYDHLKAELDRHAGKVRHTIAIHDTVTFDERGVYRDPNQPDPTPYLSSGNMRRWRYQRVAGKKVRVPIPHQADGDIPSSLPAGTDAEVGRKIETEGVGRAIREFLQAHPEWRVLHHYRNNNGLLVLRRADSEFEYSKK